MKKTSIAVVALAAMMLLGTAYVWFGSSTPAGQEPLTTLTATNFAEFENAFDKSLQGPRLVLLLSPT